MTGALHRNPVMVGLVVLTIAFILAPLVIATVIGFSSSPFLTFPPPGFSLQWFRRFLGDPEFIASLRNSLVIAGLVTVLGTVVGVLAAYGLDRLPRGPVKAVISGLVLSPLVLPIIVLALALFLFLANVDLLGTFTGIVVAHLLIAVPLVTNMVSAGLSTLNPSVTEAAASLGAGPWRNFGLVVLPQVASAIVGAAVLAFLFSFNDVTFIAFIGGADVQTLPLKLFAYIRYQLNPLIGAVSTLFVFSTLIVIVTFDRIVGFDKLVGIKD